MKKIITPFFYPLTLSVLFLVGGLILLLFTKRQRLAKCLVSAGTVILVFFSYDPGSNLILRPLESPPPSLPAASSASAPWVVVLGHGLSVDERIPWTAQLSSNSMVNLVEGVILYYRQRPGSKLLLSGGKGFEKESEADLMSRVAVSLGVPPTDIVREDQSRDTEEQVRLIRERVGENAFVLVTSASHMPRALLLFKNLGMKPLPAPTAHLALADGPLNPSKFFPKPSALRKAELAVHEYLGILWIRFKSLLRGGTS
ncbi:MAG: YdcF family protein [Deltaproteobacteria bacterium]|nr:YdcF family protein [Deltaproteobacteria bacterium]